MKYIRAIPLIILVLVSALPALAQKNASLGDNAALRYWSAFSEVQDTAITEEQARELNAILDGTAPYDDLKYKDLLEKNRLALEIMARGTSLANCDWGLDYGAEDVPVEYARKALVLGRLNVLYAFHLFIAGDKDGGVRTLAAGLRFSEDVAKGGTLFATLVAKDLLVNHLRAVAGAVHMGAADPLRGPLSTTQRALLQEAVKRLGEGLDWRTAAKRDLESLRGHYAGDSQASAALTRIVSSYLAVLDDQSKLPVLDEAIRSAPQQLASLIPNARRVLEQKQDLSNRLLQTRSLVQ
jgi:hypothetical protein